MKIAVLYGGTSGEREVSISTGKGIMNALKANGHEVIGIDFNPKQLIEILDLEADLVFLGLHGKLGEDGKIQSLLEMLNIPYVGSGVLASALAMDKSKAKKLFLQNDIPTPDSRTYSLVEKEHFEHLKDKVLAEFDLPFVVKPNQEGSTLGLTIVKQQEELDQALEEAFKHDDEIIVEDYIKGREMTIGVWGEKGKETALPVIEIIPKNEYYDYESKYAPGGSEHIVPANISMELTKQLQDYAIQAHQVLGCSVYSRVDFIVTEQDIPYILEVNTLPGMTPTSLFPDAARAIGLSYEEMIEKIVHLSLKK
ncbi:D-alanine--D-alanine ligase [Melghiribacillus thermohalophilus]|uniref:D-alanine--D-alanine ligase n=1 Tax=Melghiribacillus thermohalophilus TaxID=1324956 RepID=A0A4R3N8D5_9BACI|nr:D-alanine--D-alanine ligase [Melghiribacillus thermohalophilus]TCT25601.1 D-alanine--D-alanine ligase [Melghiribacillus thermohalophilus]